MQMLHLAMGATSPGAAGQIPYAHQGAPGPILFATYGGGAAYGVQMNVSPPPPYGAPYAGEIGGDETMYTSWDRAHHSTQHQQWDVSNGVALPVAADASADT